MAQLRVFNGFGKERWLKTYIVNKKGSLLIKGRAPVHSNKRKES